MNEKAKNLQQALTHQCKSCGYQMGVTDEQASEISSKLEEVDNYSVELVCSNCGHTYRIGLALSSKQCCECGHIEGNHSHN